MKILSLFSYAIFLNKQSDIARIVEYRIFIICTFIVNGWAATDDCGNIPDPNYKDMFENGNYRRRKRMKRPYRSAGPYGKSLFDNTYHPYRYHPYPHTSVYTEII